MKRIIYILITFAALAACTDYKFSNPYEETLNLLTVKAEWTLDESGPEGFKVQVEDMSTGAAYVSLTDSLGTAVFNVPNGVYRVVMNGKDEDSIFNGSADRVVVSGKAVDIAIALAMSKAGSIIVKEIYCGGCKKLPQEGDYQSDQYIILHNNHYDVQYLDSLCLGTLSPYNSTSTNPWVIKDEQTGSLTYPDFLPIIQAVWKFPGDGDDFPLQPGEDAVVCLRGAIDHAAQFPLSVNLDVPGYFVCYNPTYFSNTMYHPAPGANISEERYLDVVIKTGKANAYTLSLNSPAVVLFRAQGESIEDYVRKSDSVTPVPGNKVDNVVKIPFAWVKDAVEVFDGRSTTNMKRLPADLDAGYVTQTDIFTGRSLIRKVDEEASVASGYEVLVDTNNSSEDMFETEKQSLHE
jgi:hypothetical protein